MVDMKIQNDLIHWIIWIRYCEFYVGIKRKFHISWIALSIRICGFKDSSSKIPSTHSIRWYFSEKIRLARITTASSIRIQTALNGYSGSTEIKKWKAHA